MKYKIRIALLAFTVWLLSPAAISLEIQGQWVQGGILRGKVDKGTEVEFLGHHVAVTNAGDFVIGLGRDAPEEVVLTTRQKGEAIEHRYAVRKRDYDIQRIQGVPQNTVTPPEKDLKRIRKEVAETQAARAKRLERPDFLMTFQWPLLGRISGVYGSQRVYNGNPGRPHFGVDVAAPTGTPVKAPADGVVTLANSDMYFSGGTLIIDHGHGLSSSFLHLSKLLVEVGQEVRQGDLIAEVGSTGRATGPHLDWRMNWLDQRVDPTTLVPAMDTLWPAPKSEEAGETAQ